ncbi:hypothetical protein NDI33_22340 [Trichocoleus sp. DQ-A1]
MNHESLTTTHDKQKQTINYSPSTTNSGLQSTQKLLSPLSPPFPLRPLRPWRFIRF